jgi:hypothetical protein
MHVQWLARDQRMLACVCEALQGSAVLCKCAAADPAPYLQHHVVASPVWKWRHDDTKILGHVLMSVVLPAFYCVVVSVELAGRLLVCSKVRA